MSQPDPPDWMAGYRPSPPPRRYGAAPEGWKPGQSTVNCPSICCPHCGALTVHPKDNGRMESMERWDCGDCQKSFIIPRQPRRRSWHPG